MSAPTTRKFGPAPAVYEKFNEAQFRAAVEQEFARMMRTNNAFPFLRLTSPDGSTWQLTVDNTGAGTWTKLP